MWPKRLPCFLFWEILYLIVIILIEETKKNLTICQNYILRRSNVKNPSFDSASDVDYSKFDGRTSNVENLTSEEGRFGCRIFDGRPIECRKSDIRRRVFRMSNIRHSTEANIGSKIESNLFAHLYLRAPLKNVPFGKHFHNLRRCVLFSWFLLRGWFTNRSKLYFIFENPQFA